MSIIRPVPVTKSPEELVTDIGWVAPPHVAEPTQLMQGGALVTPTSVRLARLSFPPSPVGMAVPNMLVGPMATTAKAMPATVNLLNIVDLVCILDSSGFDFCRT